MLKNYAANRKRRLSALPNVGPYIYTTLKFLALEGAPYIYDISRLRIKKQARLEFAGSLKGEEERSQPGKGPLLSKQRELTKRGARLTGS
jgi:hypothetical protein